MKKYLLLTPLILGMIYSTPSLSEEIQVGVRPYYLIDRMEDGPLKEKLLSCANITFERTDFSIGHRGASMMFPEHTMEAYKAAARQGAGIVECDVAFTKDKQLVCRHAQNDLHTTTNILATPLAKKCTQPFTPVKGDQKASAECRTSDITLAEFDTLKGKMDGANTDGKSLEEYMDGTVGWRTDLYAMEGGTLMTHAESIQLFKSLGVKFTPELKTPVVDMPFDSFTQEQYAQKMIDEYKAAGVPASDVFPQSFRLEDILYWVKNEPEFGKQAVFLDERMGASGLDPNNPETFKPSMQELADMGVNYIAPYLAMLVTVKDGEIVPSSYAKEAKEAGLKIIAWSLERSGPLSNGGGFYYSTIKDVTNSDGVLYELVDVLAKDVGVEAIFSDWPATVTYYANCMGLK